MALSYTGAPYYPIRPKAYLVPRRLSKGKRRNSRDTKSTFMGGEGEVIRLPANRCGIQS